MVIAHEFGTSVEYDFYLIAVMLPALAAGVLGYACYYQFVPFLSCKAEQSGSDGSVLLGSSTWSAVNLTLLVSGAITAAIVLIAPYVLTFWDSGWAPQQFDMIVFYCRLTAASVVLSVSEAFMRALLNVKKIYAFPAAGLSLFNLVSITAILILHQHISVGAVAVGLVGGMIAQNLYLAVRLIPSRPFRYFKASIVDKETPLFLSVASTLILIELINRSYFMIDRYFAPRLGEGIVSALNYGQVLVQLPESIVGFAIGAVLFPIFARTDDTGDMASFTAAYRKAITVALLFAVPLAVFFYMNAEALVHIIYHRGAFDERSVIMTARILRTLVPSIIALFVVSASIRACYAKGWTRPVLIFAVIFLITKFAATALLPRWFGYIGISAASSVSHVGFGLGLMGYIVAQWSPHDRNRFIFTLVRLFLAGFVVYMAAYVFRRVTWPLVEEASHIVMYLALAASALIVFGSYVGVVALLGFKRYFTDVLPWRRRTE
jgi:putative peptidoglycan lipid II flippase